MSRVMSWNVASGMSGGLAAGATIALDSNVARTGIKKDGFIVTFMKQIS